MQANASRSRPPQTSPDRSSTTGDPLLTVKQLADREGMDERHVRLLIDKHGLPHYRMVPTARGLRGIKIRLSEYMAWLKRGARR